MISVQSENAQRGGLAESGLSPFRTSSLIVAIQLWIQIGRPEGHSHILEAVIHERSDSSNPGCEANLTSSG